MRKSNSSEGILVFDRYYTRKPNAVMLILQRVFFCSCLSAAAMLFVFSQFGFPVSLGFIGLASALSAALFLVLFTFLGRRYTLPAIGVIVGFVILLNLEEFWLRFSYFVDEAMLLVDGRFLFPRGYILHDPIELTPENIHYNSGMLLGCGILCGLYGLLCASSMKNRIRTLPAFIGFLILCIPRLLAETLEFNGWLIPAALLFAAAAAIEINYKNGLAVTRSGTATYRAQVREEERVFNKTTKKAPLLKRIGMRASFYSKYTTTGVCCLVIFAMAFMIGSGFFQEGSSINYTELYDLLFVSDSIDSDSHGDTAHDVVSDYFSSPDNDISTLNIINPGKGDKSIIRVSFTGDNNIYLRGDIGIDFDGTGWTTPVDTVEAWNKSGMAEYYRPAELHVLRAVLDALEIDDIKGTAESDITINYMLDTDVVFLPAYTSDFSYYNNEAFEVFGDFCVRLSDSAGNFINSVQCTSISLDLSGASSLDEAENILKCYSDNNINMDDLYTTIVTEMEAYPGADELFSSYSDYVHRTYLNVPEFLDNYLDDYIEDNNIKDLIEYKGSNKSLYYYSAASAISDYLSSNYIYSLSGENRGEYAVIQFLNESKSGHCSLYASAMTLLLRELDIPARYCTGFSIYPSKINGHTVELKQRNLHAWVEVYIDELGWVTFDPTSAAVSENITYGESGTDNALRPDEDASEESKENESREDNITKPQEDKPSAGDSKDDKPSESGFEIPVHIIVIAVCVSAFLAISIALICRYKSVKKKANAIIMQADSLDFKSIYNCLIDIFYMFKLVPHSGELPSDYYAECEKIFKAGITDNTAILEKAAFGSENATTSEKQALSEIFRKTCENACRHSSPMRKHKLRKLIIKLNTTK